MKEIELFDIDGELESVAIVDAPAIQIDFLCFSEAEKPMQLQFTDDEKHILTGAFLVPELRIIRFDDKGEPYNVYFSRETVERLAYNFLSNRQMNIGHNTDTDRLQLIESWIKTNENDKSVALGIDAPVGTWFASVKVLDENLWSEIKHGKYNGFSISGAFSRTKSQEFAAEEDADERLLNEIKSLIDECDE
jgi:hypothetical protein